MDRSLQATNSLLSILVHIQAHLDGDLSLEALAKRSGFSPSHFHRVFRKVVGETPKQYTQRLRLERAAIQLCIHKSTVLEIALACGFENHETFSRAFRRLFGEAPSQVQKLGFSRSESNAEELSVASSDYELSSTKIVTFQKTEVAFIRHVGPYEEVSDTLWKELMCWADERGLRGRRILMGICQDAPGLTPQHKLRFDAAMCVAEPFWPEDQVGHQTIPEAQFAVTRYVGPYATLPHAYRSVVDRLKESKDHQLTGVPTIELYQTTTINQYFEMNHTDIYLPVVPK